MEAIGNAPRRVALVVRPAAGGMVRHLETLLSHLNRARYAPTLYAPPGFPALREVNAPRMALPLAPSLSPFTLRAEIQWLTKMLREQADLIHAHGLRVAASVVPTARRLHLPVLFTAHNLAPAGLLPRILLRALGRRACRVLAVSEAVKTSLLRAGVPESRIMVIPNGIDLTPFDTPVDVVSVRARFGIPSDGFLVLAVGRLASEKGYDLLLEAFARLHAALPQTHLAIAGTGPQAEVLWRQAATLRLRGVSFLGYQAAVAPLYATADVVAIPSRQEGQGMVALEAMAARRPVVASAVGGLPETVLDGETGRLVPPEDPAALSEALRQLYTDAALRRRMGENGRVRVEQEFSAARMTRQIEAAYASCLRP
jgi:glycosyltransferase involved in cell wall biosynthesis